MANHRAGDEAAELRSAISGIVFDMNTQLSQLTQLAVDAADLGQQVGNLEIRSLEVAKTTQDLKLHIPQELHQTIAKYRVDITALEDYMLSI